jgi:predicted PurR-regulated permease PerM
MFCAMTDRIADTHNSVAVAVFTVALVASLSLTAWLFSGFLTDFILAALFVGLLGPWNEKLGKKLGYRSTLASVISCLLLAVCIAVPATFVVTSLSVEVHSAYVTNRDSVTMARLQEILFGDSFFAQQAAQVASLVGFDYTPQSISALLGQVIGSVTSFLGKQVNELLTNIVGFIYHMTLMLLMVFYLFLDGVRLREFMFRLSPIPDPEEQLIADKFKSVGQAILLGNGFGSVIQGLLGGIAMAFAGIPSPVLWATVMTVAAFLPLVGISIVSIPCTIYLALNGKILAAVVFFSLCTFVSLFVENVVKTKLIGAHMKMHSFVVFISILGGLSTFGILGLLYGPLVVTFFMTMSELYEQHYRPRIMRRFKRLTVS